MNRESWLSALEEGAFVSVQVPTTKEKRFGFVAKVNGDTLQIAVLEDHRKWMTVFLPLATGEDRNSGTRIDPAESEDANE